MRIMHLVLSVVLLDYSGWRVHRVPEMLVCRRWCMIAMMLRLGNHWCCMVLVIVMRGFRVIHCVPFDRSVRH